MPLQHTQDGDTALHFAACNGHTECIVALLAAGADVHAKAKVRSDTCTAAPDDVPPAAITTSGAPLSNAPTCLQWNYTPLHSANWNGHADCVKLILEAGADSTVLDNVRRWPGALRGQPANSALATAVLRRVGWPSERCPRARHRRLPESSCPGPLPS